MRESAAISSIVPNGKLGADPTIYKRTNIKIIFDKRSRDGDFTITVFRLIRRDTEWTSTLRDTGSIGA